jgi:AcrR family transcriptional regulator
MTKARRPVKRTYSSPLRAEQTRSTRARIIDAAAAQFAKHGYAAVSIDAIAEAAGVSRATVFTAVGGKPALLAASYAAAFALAAGGGEGIPLVERPRAAVVHAETTAEGYLAAYAALATDISLHLAAINEAMREAAASDADVRALFDHEYAYRRRGADRIVAETAKRAPLREGIDRKEAADAVWVLNDPSVFFMLVHRSGWSPDRYREWLARALENELLGT